MFEATRQKLPQDLQRRLEFQKHNFLDAQPLKDATRTKAFILRMVCWNWADDVAIKILRSLVPVLRASPETVLLINDQICCEPGMVDPHVEKGLRHLDMVMMVLNNAKVRMEHEWRALVTEASPHFKVRDPYSRQEVYTFSRADRPEKKLERITTNSAANSTVALMEVRWNDDAGNNGIMSGD